MAEAVAAGVSETSAEVVIKRATGMIVSVLQARRRTPRFAAPKRSHWTNPEIECAHPGHSVMNDFETQINNVDAGSAVDKYTFGPPSRLGPASVETTTRSSTERRVTRPIKWLFFVSGLFAVAISLSGCKDAIAVSAVQPADVDVAPVLVKPIRYWDEFNGRISAIGSVEIRPRVSGYVDRVAYREGDEVRRGDLLFAIDPRPYQAVVDSATARLERARATARLAQARDQRAQALVQTNAVSRDEADIRRATYAQSQADVLDAEAALAVAKLNVQFTEVRAPIDGRVSRAFLTVGNLAVADQSLLTTMVSQDPVYVYFDVDEHNYLRYRAEAREGRDSATALTARVGLVNEEGFQHVGKVDFLDNKVDAATGSIRVRATLKNGDRTFTPGLYARVQVSSDSEVQATLIDDKAVLTDQDRKYVYVLSPEGTAQRRDIKPGRTSDGLRVVESGLMPGDKVIIGGLQRIYFSGAPVTPSEVRMESQLSMKVDSQEQRR
jgi:membrane fusion protein, multidrug efflux system